MATVNGSLRAATIGARTALSAPMMRAATIATQKSPTSKPGRIPAASRMLALETSSASSSLSG